MDERYIVSFTAYTELRDKLESMLKNLKDRKEMLERNVTEYSNEGRGHQAEVNQIRPILYIH